MPTRNFRGAAPQLSPELLAQLGATLEPLRKDEAPVYRGTERLAIAAVQTPARARILSRGCKVITECCRKRNLETTRPGALKFHRTALAGYLVAEPVIKYDQFEPDLYELKWTGRRAVATMDMLPILQPRNMEVADGSVMEIPLSVETLKDGAFLIFHLDAQVTRPIQQLTEEEKAARRRQKPTDTATSQEA